MRHHLFINIIGKHNVGKTTVMRAIQRLLASHNIDVTALWGIDGAPSQSKDMRMHDDLKVISKKTKITIEEFDIGKMMSDCGDEYKVLVAHQQGLGFVVVAYVGSTPMVATFKEYEKNALDRARSLAARLAVKFGVDVRDDIPRTLEVVQPGDYVPNSRA